MTETTPPAPLSVSATCQHCKRRRVNRPRGLCWGCYYTPGIVNRYPSVSKYGRRGVGGLNRSRMPEIPTDAPPGSAAKLAILQERARLNVSLWHPMDARYPGDPRNATESLAVV
jgi:hypothetical protein